MACTVTPGASGRRVRAIAQGRLARAAILLALVAAAVANEDDEGRIAAQLTSGDVNEREAALLGIRRLGLGDPQWAARISPLLGSAVRRESQLASDTLLAMGAPGHALLIDRFLADFEPPPHGIASGLLLAPPEIGPQLVARLPSATAEQGQRVLELLGLLGPVLPDSFGEQLVPLLQDPSKVGDLAALVLATYPSRTAAKAIPRLAAVLRGERRGVSMSASLSVLNAVAHLGKQAGRDIESAMRQLATASSGAADSRTLCALWRVADDGADVADALLSNARRASRHSLLASWEAVGYLGTAGAKGLRPLLELIRAAELAAPPAFVEILAEISRADRSDLAALLEPLAHADGPLAAALLSLPGWSEGQIAALFGAAMASSSVMTHNLAVRGLFWAEHAPTQAMVPPLLAAIHAGDLETAVLGIEVLGRGARREARLAEPLTALLSSGDPHGYSAARALGGVGANASGAVPQLLRAAKEWPAELAGHAVLALGRIGVGTPEVLAHLGAGLEHTDPMVRLACAVSMLCLRHDSEAARRVLEDALRSEDLVWPALLWMSGSRIESPPLLTTVEELWWHAKPDMKAMMARVSHLMTGDDALYVRRMSSLLAWGAVEWTVGGEEFACAMRDVRPEHLPVRTLTRLRYDLDSEPRVRRAARRVLQEAGIPVD